MLTPADSKEAARFDRVVKVVNRVGYSHAVVVGRGGGPADALFALTATRGDSGVLVVTVEPGGSAAHLVVRERAKTSADIGLRGIDFTPFLGTRDFYDIEVAHHPFMLETTRAFSTHHVLRRQGEALLPTCGFGGAAASSYSKGIGSNSWGRDVTVTQVPGATPVFTVRAVEKTTRQQDREPATTTDRSDATKRYEIPASGMYRAVPAK